MLEQMEQSEKEYAARTNDERKLDEPTYELLRDAERADTSVEARQRFRFALDHDKDFKTDSKDRVRIELGIRPRSEQANVETVILSLDGVVVFAAKDFGYILCQIHPKNLRKLASIPAVVSIDIPVGPHYKSVTSAGDMQLKADSARMQFSVGGLGVNVGVISDGVDNWQDAKNNFELPDMTGKVLDAGSGNEGTAMLEIVHDLAPYATLWFCSSGETYVTFANAVKTLSSNGCKIIVDDVGFLNEPYFTDEDDTLGAAIRNFLSSGGTFVSAGGNDNYSIYNDPDGYSVFSGTTNIGPGNLNVFPNSQTTLDFTVNANSTQVIFFEWATSWKHPLSDYNLYVYDESGTQVTQSEIAQFQNGSYPPRERVNVQNTTSSTKLYTLSIKYYSGTSTPVDFKIVSNAFAGKLSNMDTDNRHLYGHPCYPKVIGVAAYDAELPDQMATYSSGGPLTMFSTLSNQWSSENTPLVTATSGVSTWVGNNPTGNPYWPDGYPLFYGTSAAAPHIAAIAALYFNAFLTRTRDNFITDLESSAAPIEGKGGNGSWDARAGYGKANALACLKTAQAGGSLPPPGTPTIIVNSMSSTQIPNGQTTVTVTVTFSNQLEFGTTNYPNPRLGVEIDGVWSDSIVLSPATPGVHSFSYPFAIGSHTIYFQQTENDKTECPNSPIDCTSIITTATATKTFSVTWAPITVTLDQKTQEGGRVGVLQVWNSTSFSAPFSPGATPSYPKYSTQTFRGDTNVISGEKYNNWNSLPDVTNHHSFYVDGGATTFLSNFNHVADATLQAQLIDGGNPGGTLNFLDPWRRDTTDSYGLRNKGMSDWARPVNYSQNNIGLNSPDKGVLLGQDPNKVPTYYTVSAPATQTNVNGYTGYFQNWSAPGGKAHFQNSSALQTAVAFDSAGAVVTALYKGHLVSSFSSAAGIMSQRKIVTDAAGGIDLFYESGNKGWWTRSTDNGLTWTQEDTLSSASASHEPSACAGGNYVFVTWSEIGSYNGNVCVKRIMPAKPYTTAIRRTIGTFDYSYPGVPVIAASSDGKKILVVYRSDYDLYYSLSSDSGLTYSSITSLLESSGLPEPASIAYNPSNSKFYLATDDGVNGHLYSFNGTSWSDEGSTPLVSAIGYVSQSPQVAVDGAGVVHLVWIGFDEVHNRYVVLYCSKNGTTWSQVTQFVDGNGYQPASASISGHNDSNGGASVLYADAGGYITNPYRMTSAGTWYTLSNHYTTSVYCPSLLEKSTPSAVKSITGKNSSQPYALSFESRDNSKLWGEKISYTEGVNPVHPAFTKVYKVLSLTDDNNKSNAIIEVGNVQVAGSQIGFSPEDASMSTLPFNVTAGSGQFELSVESSEWNGTLYGFASITDTAAKASTANVARLGFSDSVNFRQLYKFNTVGISKRLSFDVSASSADALDRIYSNLLVISDTTKANDNIQKDFASNQGEVPVEYGLTQNYPNPFNPSTVISYQLPKDGQVILKVYDILGREVKTLVNQDEPAGYHQVTLDGTHLSSGIYFYRIYISGSDGKNFVSTKKMILVK